MTESEIINQYGSRVSNVAMTFLGEVDYTNVKIKNTGSNKTYQNS